MVQFDTPRTILVAAAAALLTGTLLASVIWGLDRLSADHPRGDGLAHVVRIFIVGGFVIATGIGLSAGHFAARFDHDRPVLSAALAAALVATSLLGFFWTWAGDFSATVSIVAIGITVVIATLAASSRTRGRVNH